MTFIIIWWIVSAHKWFKGPKVLLFVTLTELWSILLNTLYHRSISSTRCLVERVMSSRALAAKRSIVETRALTDSMVTRKQQISREYGDAVAECHMGLVTVGINDGHGKYIYNIKHPVNHLI